MGALNRAVLVRDAATDRLSLRCCSGTPPNVHSTRSPRTPAGSGRADDRNAPAIVMPSAPISVNSDRPIRPGGCSWRKITSGLGPLSARHLAMRRSKVRRTPGANPRSRRQASSKMATARMPGAASSVGTISLSHMLASGSERRPSFVPPARSPRASATKSRPRFLQKAVLDRSSPNTGRIAAPPRKDVQGRFC